MKRLVIAISGASGMPYALRFIENVPAEYQLHIIASEVGTQILKSESGFDLTKESLLKLTGNQSTDKNRIVLHQSANQYAAVASGSFKTEGMIIIPCSMKTLAGVANGYAQSLIERAADVTLKEKRRLVVVVRETPFNRIHLQNMLNLQDAGATILPANPGFYHHPQTVDDLVDFVVARALDAMGIPQNLVKGWKED